MASLTKHHSTNVAKILFAGESGAGKTGALASLASVGYNLRVLDLDNGLDVLVDLLTNPSSQYDKAGASRVSYITLTEEMRMINGAVAPRTASVWPKVTSVLNDWKDGEESLGPVAKWGPDDVLVIDSLTMLGISAMNYVLQLNARLGKHPHQSDWGQAQNLLEALLQLLYSTAVPCNVIINCHLTRKEEHEDKEVSVSTIVDNKRYPLSLGRALSPKIGRYFNTILLASAEGTRGALKRKIYTTTISDVDLKNTAPLKVKPEYPLATGLAEYFFALHGRFPLRA